MNTHEISGIYVDVVQKRIFRARISIENGIIRAITHDESAPNHYLIPGFVNAHLHIESTMLVPLEYAKAVIPHGTVAVVSDPHEIANVCGIDGVKFMIENAKLSPLKVYFGAPSCVPATDFETSGANLDANAIRYLFETEKLPFLSEMMNFPGVIYNDPAVHQKLAVAKELKKPIDGHAPGLSGESLKTYAAAGISTDHECVSLEEAKEKMKNGIKVQIREGSAAKNFDTLSPLIESHSEKVMLCTDDSHPDDLLKGHINLLVKRALEAGYDLFKVLRACSYNPIKHYKLPVGLLQTGDPADFIQVDSLSDLNVQRVFIRGEEIYSHGKLAELPSSNEVINSFNCTAISKEQLIVPAKKGKIKVIEAIDGDLITNEIHVDPKIAADQVMTDTERDILKLVLINRYRPSEPQVAFIHNFNLKKGAIASSIAHDSHNLIAVGTNDDDLTAAINALIESKGGIAAFCGTEKHLLPLPVAGLMSNQPLEILAPQYLEIQNTIKQWGSSLKAPLMTLSFMALLVIPSLKLSDKGLFDGNQFALTNLWLD